MLRETLFILAPFLTFLAGYFLARYHARGMWMSIRKSDRFAAAEYAQNYLSRADAHPIQLGNDLRNGKHIK